MGGGFYCDSPAPRLRFASPGDSPAPASTERWQPTAKSKAPERSVVKVAGAVASVWRGRKNTGACAASVDPRRAPVVCSAAEPIICAVDVTGSMEDWPKVIYDKLPMFYGPSSHLSTRPNISESHSEMSTRVPFCIAQVRTRPLGSRPSCSSKTACNCGALGWHQHQPKENGLGSTGIAIEHPAHQYFEVGTKH